MGFAEGGGGGREERPEGDALAGRDSSGEISTRAAISRAGRFSRKSPLREERGLFLPPLAAPHHLGIYGATRQLQRQMSDATPAFRCSVWRFDVSSWNSEIT